MTTKDLEELVDTRKIVKSAKSDYVTIEKLTGEEIYFPETRHVIALVDEKPQYIILLTNSRKEGSVTFGVNQGEFTKVGEGNSCLLLTENSIIGVSERSGHVRIPYSSIRGVLGDFKPGGGIVINISTANYRFNLAKKSDPEAIIEATKYLHSRIPI